jgi:hypothetical protein
VASNKDGTVDGPEIMFTASASSTSPPSDLVTEPAEATAIGVVLRGELNPGGPSTTSYFEYSARTCDESVSCIKRTAVTGPLVGNTQQEVQPVEVTGLTPGAEYSYRLVASNKDGTVDGPEIMFTAPSECLCRAIQGEPFGTLISPLPGAAPPAKPIPTPKRLTNAQKLARALRRCRATPKSQRAVCDKHARETYGAKHSGTTANLGRK